MLYKISFVLIWWLYRSGPIFHVNRHRWMMLLATRRDFLWISTIAAASPERSACETEWNEWATKNAEILSIWSRRVISWNLTLDEKGHPNIGPAPCAGFVTMDAQTKENMAAASTGLSLTTREPGGEEPAASTPG